MEIISRTRWGARYERGFAPAPLPASEVWLHHSVTIAPDLAWLDADRDGVEDDEERAMRLLEQIGEDRFGGGISYTFAVMPSGRIYEGHGVDRQGAHTGGRNNIARAIVWVGNYDNDQPTVAQLRSTAWLLQHGHQSGWWRAARLNGGHQQAPGASTGCPGRNGMSAIPGINQLAAGGPIQEDDVSFAENLTVPAGQFKGTKYQAGTMLAWTSFYAAETWTRVNAMQAQLAAIANDKDITPEQLAAATDAAVKKYTPTAAQTAAVLLPMVEDIAERVLGADNSALAGEFLRQLREALPATTEGN
jgi:hypothetical protein